MIQKTKTQEKALRSFNYQCRRASKCRHEIYQMSCSACKHLYKCEIQQKIELARSKM